MTVAPVQRLQGTLAMPGDKSISHRALILAAMAQGTSVVRGAATGADVASTLACLGRLGLAVPDGVEPELALGGLGWQVRSGAELDAGNSGTTMRLLAGALAGRAGSFVLTGDASLSRRPMERVALPLRRMGAGVTLGPGGRPPVTVQGGPLVAIDYEMPVASAQVKAAVLLAGLQAEGTTTLREPGPTRDHTERFLAWLGVPVTAGAGCVSVPGGGLPLPAFQIDVPGDFSSAAFWLVAGLLVPGSEVAVTGVGVNPTRTGLLGILASMGGVVSVIEAGPGPEPTGTLRVAASALRATEVSGPVVANAIDELPVVAVAATQAEGTTVIRDAAELRVKESDRLAVLAAGLRALGADVEEAPDGLAITGPTPLRGARVDSAGDHRMAMAFAVAALVASGPVTIAGWEGTTISYPGFLDHLAVLTR